jgi:hypothetical protein
MLNFSKILFISDPGKTGILVTNTAGRRKQRSMRFQGIHAALDWCIQSGVQFIYFPSSPAVN